MAKDEILDKNMMFKVKKCPTAIKKAFFIVCVIGNAYLCIIFVYYPACSPKAGNVGGSGEAYPESGMREIIVRE